MKRILFVPILLSLAVSSFAARIPLALYGLTPQQGVTPGMADMVSDMVRMKLRSCGRFDLVEKAKMEEILKEHAFQQTGCTETECAVKMGKVLNVKKMVVGGLGKIGTAFRLSLRVVDVETAVIEVEDAESQTVKEEEMEGKLVPPLVARLCPLIKAGGSAIAPPSGGGVEVPAGSLTVNSTPSGATVFLDGEPKGLTPQGLTDVPAGEHQIVLTLEGYKDYQEAVTVTKDAKKLVSAVLKMQIGGLRIFTTPSGASVSVDGVPRGVTTESGLLVSGLKAGEHMVRASKARYEAYEISAFVEPDVTKEVKIDLSAKPGSVVVTSTPSGASVYLDGAYKGVTPCSASGLTPGDHKVGIEKIGYKALIGFVNVKSERSEQYSVVLEKVFTIAVLDLIGKDGVSSDTARSISEQLRIGLRKKQLVVVDQNTTDNVLREIRVSGCKEGFDCAVKVGRLLNANMIIYGFIGEPIRKENKNFKSISGNGNIWMVDVVKGDSYLSCGAGPSSPGDWSYSSISNRWVEKIYESVNRHRGEQ